MRFNVIIWKLLTGSVLTALALVFIYSAVFVMPANDQEWQHASAQTTGTVIELRETYRNRAYCDHLVIQYNAPDNRKLSFTPYDCYSKGTFHVGQQVSVRYNTGNPSIAYMDHGDNDQSTSIALLAFSALLLVIGIWFIAVSFRKKESPAA